MKKIITIIPLVLIYFSSCLPAISQLQKNIQPDLDQKNYKLKKALNAYTSFQNDTDTTGITTLCDNGNFENGQPLNWNNWHGAFGNIWGNSTSLNISSSDYTWYWGLLATGSSAAEYQNFTSSSPGCSTCIGDSGSDYQQSNQIHHQIVSSGADPLVPSLSTTHANSNFALRLGNGAVNNGCEFVEKKFVKTASNNLFSFWYAFVMSNPGHGSGLDPYFGINVYTETGNVLTNVTYPLGINIGNGTYCTYSSDPFASSTSITSKCDQSKTTSIKYKDWNYVSFNLSTIPIGQTVVIRIWTRDCSQCGDFCYAYLDDFCSKPDVSNPSGFINISNADSCQLPGKICVNYTVPTDGKNTGTTQLTLNFFQNGIPVGTPLISSSFTSNGNYCFTLTAANSPSTDFDYSITGDFTFQGFTLPAQYIGLAPDGITAGQNNDYKINCNQHIVVCNTCKQVIQLSSLITGNIVTAAGYNLQNAQLNFTSLTNLQQVQISIADIAYSWDKEGCKNCKSEAIGRGCLFPVSGTQTIGSLVWSNIHNSNVPPAINANECPGELIWDLGTVLTPGSYSVPLNISLPSPTVPGCCSLHIDKLCLKVSFKDVNCNTCDTIVCIGNDDKNCCKGGYWKSEQITWSKNAGNQKNKQATTGVVTPPILANLNLINIDCNKQQRPYVLQCNQAYTFQAVYVCADKTCDKKITYQVTGAASISGVLPATFTPTQAGTYQIVYYAWCGNKICDSCKFSVYTDCGGNGGSTCSCHFNPILTGEGINRDVSCGQSINYFSTNIPLNLNPGFACVNNDGQECSTPGSFTVTLKNVGTNTITTLTPPNYSYTYLAAGTYIYTLSGTCGGNTCTCSFNIIIPGTKGSVRKLTKADAESADNTTALNIKEFSNGCTRTCTGEWTYNASADLYNCAGTAGPLTCPGKGLGNTPLFNKVMFQNFNKDGTIHEEDNPK